MTFTLNTKIYGYQCDVYGHLNNANYLQLYEAARAEALTEMELPVAKLLQIGIMLFIIKIEIEYKKAVELEDNITIKSKIIHNDRLKAIWEQEIYNSAGERCSTAKVTGVYVTDGKPTRISKEMQNFFEKYVTNSL